MVTLKDLLGEDKARSRMKTEQELFDVIDNVIKDNKLNLLYDNDIIKYSSRIKGIDNTVDMLCVEAIAKYLIEKNIFNFEVKKESNYSRGDRKKIREKLKNINFYEYINETSYGKGSKNMMEDRICQCLFSQEKVSDCLVIDFQIPLVDGGANNIDIMFEKNGKCHIAEAKKFESPETLLRCILEIETYYQQINWPRFIDEYKFEKKDVIKTILVPEDSEAYKEYRVMKEGYLPYLNRLFNLFNIQMYSFALDKDNNQFLIKEAN